MRKECDFSKAKRANEVPHLVRLQAETTAGKVRITTYLDADILEWLKSRGEAEHKRESIGVRATHLTKLFS